ncbi:MAG TPA: hypothetical protein VK518_05670 [Puia sp.]|nr:hypothetical protein [Puia sp.]
MKKQISVVAIAVLFAVVSAFAGKVKQTPIQWWNVDHPFAGSPGIYQLSATQIKGIYCPGNNNVECAYLISNTSTIIKKPF